MLRLILVPLDGSALAEQALPLAMHIARQAGAELRLLQVVPLHKEYLALHTSARFSDERIKRPLDNARCYLEQVAARLDQQAWSEPQPLTISVHTELGLPASTIAEYAATNGVDLIVMATHGRSGLRRLALGSVADRLLHLCYTPTIIVGPEATPTNLGHHPTLQRMLIALDGSDLATAVIPIATEVARLFDSELILMRATPVPAESYASPELTPAHTLRWHDAPDLSDGHLEQVAAELTNNGFHVRTFVRPHNVVRALLTLAQETDANLLAMSTHAREGLGRLLYGSVTDSIIRGSPRPTLVVRPPEAAALPPPAAKTG